MNERSRARLRPAPDPSCHLVEHRDPFTRYLGDPTLDVVIDGDRARARLLHVASAPAVFVNGKPMTGERTLKQLESVIATAATAR